MSALIIHVALTRVCEINTQCNKMADLKYQKEGRIDSEDDRTDTLIAQNIQDSEIRVHHEVKQGVEFSGQQGDEAIADAVTLKYGGEQEVVSHDTVSGEQEFNSTISGGEQEVESSSTVSSGQEVKSHCTVIGEQEVKSQCTMIGEQEMKSHCSVTGEQEVVTHGTVSHKQEVESHCIVSSIQFTTEGVHGGTVYVEELQTDGNGITEIDCPPQDSGMEEVNQELKYKVDYDVRDNVDDESDVFEAAQSGNIVLVKNYLDLGLSPDLTDEEGCSILHHAASHGQVEVIKLLHERGCCIDPVDRHGRTPLHHAATSGGAAPLGVLVDLGSNVNYLDYEGNTPLKRAVMCENYSTQEELLKYGGVEGVECEQREEVSDEKGTRLEFIAALDDETVRDLLFQSSYLGDMQTVLAILEHRYPVDVVDGYGYTALHIASEGGHVEVIRELIARRVSANVQANDGYTPLHSAAHNGKLEAVHELLRLGGRASMTKVAGTYGTPLHEAALCGHKKVMSVLVDEGCPIDVVDSRGQSVLHFAAEGGHVELLGWLLECGLDVNREDADGNTPLHSAACAGKLEAVHELLRLGGKASMTKVAGTYGTPLHEAALCGHKKVLSVLLDEGCPIDVVDSRGQSVLHFAAEGGHVELLGWLLECGLDVNREDADGYTPLHSAAGEGKLEVVHELLRLGGKASMTKVAGTCGTPLHQAAFGGHKKVLSVLLDEGCPIDVVDSRGQSVLHFAAEGGHIEIVGWLLECGLDVNREDANGYTPLHSAAHKGKLEAVHELLRLGGKASMTKVAGTYGTPLHQAAFGGHKKVMSVLLDEGCPIDVVDSSGQSVLHFAAEGGHVELLGWLLECGLDVNREDADGNTPLHSAAGEGKLEVVHELLRLGGKASMTKVAGTYGTPLHQATFGGHKKVMSVLLDEGCPIDVVDSSGQSVLHSAAQGGHVELLGWLLECGLDVNREDADGYTPLHSAAGEGKLEAVHELLRLGEKASMTKVAGTYGTPLHQATFGGHKKVMSVLLDEGCPIDVVDSRGQSVLHFAAEGGHVELLGWLLECGLDVNREDADGNTPLHSAAGEGKLEVVHELLRLGGKASMTKVAGTYGTPLHQAALCGHKKVMSVLLDEGCPIDVVDSRGQSVLHFAAEGGHVELLGWLLECGLDVNREDADGNTPLHSAAGEGKLEVVHELLRLGGKASMTKVAGTYGTPLHQAALCGHKKVMSVLLDEGCPIDVVDSRGQSVLHFAAKGGHVELLGWLLECGLDVNREDADGNTPLHSAAGEGKLEAVHELLRLGGKASMTKVAGTYGTPLHQAALCGHKKVLSVLLDEGCPIDVVDSRGQSVLHFAAEGGHVELLGWLLECGLDVNREDADGYTPLHSAAGEGKLEAVHELLRLGGKASMTKVAGTYGTPLHQAAFGGHKKVMSVLLDEGCPIDVVDSSGQSVLHFAAEGGHVELLGWLLECGLDVNREDADGYTPLHSAAGEGKLEAVHELLRLGGKASVTKVAGTYGTPLHQATFGGHKKVMSVLLDEGCPIDVVDSRGQSVLHFAVEGGHVELLGWLLECGLDVNREDANGYTPLHSAAGEGKLEVVHELLRLGGKASMTKVAGTYGTPLHEAALCGHKKVMSVLLDEGCPIDVVDSRGQSVLHFAAKGGHVELLGWLLECGLDVNREDADGNTPLHSAAGEGKLEAVHELLRLGGKASMTKVAGTCGTPLHEAALCGHKKVMSVLLDEGCPIDVVDSRGQSVLHFAVEGGHVELLGWLVECGLDVNGGDANGYTPLHSAAAAGKLEAVHALLRLGANPVIMAGPFGTPLHQAVFSGSVQVMSVLSDAIHEQYNSQHPMATESEVDSPNQLVCVPDNNPLDCCNPMGLTPLMWAAGEGHVEIVKFLISKHCNFTAQNRYGLSMFEVAVMCGQINKLHELCKASGFNDLGGSIRESILSLKNRNLLDPCKLLILGSFTGDPLVITTLSRDESMFTEAAHQTWSMTKNVLYQYFTLHTVLDIFQQLHLPDECPLSPLHISLIICKISMNYSGGNSIKSGAKDYKVFIDKLISHSSTKYTVNKLFPNGLSPLDIARQFDFRDIASMIERAGGGPGLWANLPKQIEQKYIVPVLAVKELFECDEVGKEATLRILSFLGSQLVGGEEISDANRIMGGRPSRSLIDKHVLSKLQHKDEWERVGNLLEVDEDELDRLGEEAPSDDKAYYSMLKHWLKHGSQVTWKTLLDAIGHFETKKTVDDITAKIVEELASSQVRKCDYVCYVLLEMTALEMGIHSSLVIHHLL